MPWMETNAKKQRQQFYRDYASGQWSMSELCDRYQISRPTGYKWVDRIAHFADRERLFRSIVIGCFGDRERSGATPVSLWL
jgi:hypothetical protein